VETIDSSDPAASTSRSADSTAGAEQAPIVVMMPIFNDWPALKPLLKKLDRVLFEHRLRARVLLIDDGSVDPVDPALSRLPYRAIGQVEVLALRRNLGHQRAIAIGAAYVEQYIDCSALVIMDGDGEDAPEHVPRLLSKLAEEKERAIVFGARVRRSESLLFLICYHLYRVVHLVLTGIPVRVGNFSAVPPRLLRRLVVVSEMWNHYAAAVIRSRIPYCTVPAERAPRLAGRSRMNFVSLVTHGLSAISVFGEIVGVRLLLVTGLLMVLTFAGLLAAVVHGAASDAGLPGWATAVIGLLGLLLLQSLVLVLVLVVITLSSRSNANFLPARDYGYFVDGCQVLYPPAQAAASADAMAPTAREP
jgi:hypothetical protein